MQRPRGFSSYSASSNETILEACSSSPYATHTPGPADAVRFPLDPAIVPLPRTFTSGPDSTVQTVRRNDDDVAGRKKASSGKEQDIDRNNAAGNDDEEESIDWDAESEEDTADSAVAPQPRQVVKRAKVPQNMGFHFDWWMARIGTAAVNVSILLTPNLSPRPLPSLFAARSSMSVEASHANPRS
ncbi:hypothetical protein AYO22_09468 [Fonsecaea multimorphosa]|nr:hypothetical protein AYO22_09468 [Fonsecaea multimorphosa]